MRLVPLSALAPALFLAAPALAQQQIVDRALDDYVLPGFEMLAAETSELAAVAAEDCAPGSETLRAAYGTAFDAWIGVSHLRFGPLEAENRAFALAFWPDRNGATPGSLGQLLSEEDPVIGQQSDLSVHQRSPARALWQFRRGHGVHPRSAPGPPPRHVR